MAAFEIIIPAVFLLWLAATAALATAGLRRWRWGTPGGRSAVLAAGLGLLFCAMMLLLLLVGAVFPDAARWASEQTWPEFVWAAAWLGSLWLSLVAAHRATAPVAAPLAGGAGEDALG